MLKQCAAHVANQTPYIGGHEAFLSGKEELERVILCLYVSRHVMAL